MTINQLPTLQSPSASAVVPVSQNGADYKITLGEIVPQKGALPNNTNLNTVTTPGTYLIDGGNTYTNSPSSYGILECVSHRNDRVYAQRITTTDRIYFRYVLNAAVTPPQWSGWRYIAGTQV